MPAVPAKVAVTDVVPNRRRGGDVRTILSPATAGATTGFMGVATIEVGEAITEHYHPYSEEFIYVVRGELSIRLDGEVVQIGAGEGLLVPIGIKHRLENHGDIQAFIVFHLGPLAPRPDLGHVDTEELPNPDAPHGGLVSASASPGAVVNSGVSADAVFSPGPMVSPTGGIR